MRLLQLVQLMLLLKLVLLLLQLLLQLMLLLQLVQLVVRVWLRLKLEVVLLLLLQQELILLHGGSIKGGRPTPKEGLNGWIQGRVGRRRRRLPEQPARRTDTVRQQVRSNATQCGRWAGVRDEPDRADPPGGRVGTVADKRRGACRCAEGKALIPT